MDVQSQFSIKHFIFQTHTFVLISESVHHFLFVRFVLKFVVFCYFSNWRTCSSNARDSYLIFLFKFDLWCVSQHCLFPHRNPNLFFNRFFFFLHLLFLSLQTSYFVAATWVRWNKKKKKIAVLFRNCFAVYLVHVRQLSKINPNLHITI